jgi:putative hydrolase of the HAD superfamily
VKPTRIQAVTFDIGGTLIRPWPSVGHVYAEVARRHGVGDVAPEFLEARFKAAWRAREQFNDTRAGWEAVVDEAFQGLAAQPPSTTFFPELYERFARADAWRIFDDVLPTLDALAALGLRLGVISNWDERLRDLLQNLRLDRRFEIIVVSCEVGSAKPAPAIFHEAAARLRLPPAAILHVGDSLEMDLHGARAAGFHARRIDRGPGGSEPDRLTQLSDLIAQLTPPAASAD